MTVCVTRERIYFFVCSVCVRVSIISKGQNLSANRNTRLDQQLMSLGSASGPPESTVQQPVCVCMCTIIIIIMIVMTIKMKSVRYVDNSFVLFIAAPDFT